MRFYKIFVAILIFLLSVAAVHPQRRTAKAKGKIAGFVVDCKEGRVPGAIITVVGKKYKQKSETNDEGGFEIEVPIGRYEIIVEAKNLGFSATKKSGLDVYAGGRTYYQIVMGSISPIIVDY